jgi:hypothetical protein
LPDGPDSRIHGLLGGAGRTALVFAALLAAAALAIALAPPDTRPSATRLAILTLGILVAWTILRRSAPVIASSPELFEMDLQPRPTERSEIAGLRSVETDLRMSTASAFGVEIMLKPQLRELTRWRLLRNHGVDMDAAPDAARQIVGERLWRLVLAGDTFPEFRAPGIPLDDVRAAVDRLERI